MSYFVFEILKHYEGSEDTPGVAKWENNLNFKLDINIILRQWSLLRPTVFSAVGSAHTAFLGSAPALQALKRSQTWPAGPGDGALNQKEWRRNEGPREGERQGVEREEDTPDTTKSG